MGKPRVCLLLDSSVYINLLTCLQMIVLIRHAQSEGNKNREIHQMIPDHRVQLTPEGHKQVNQVSRSMIQSQSNDGDRQKMQADDYDLC